MTAPMTPAELSQLMQLIERARLEHGKKEEALFAELEVNLADLSATTWKPYKPGQAFGLVYPVGAGGPVLQLQGRGLGSCSRFATGDMVRGYFEEVQIRKTSAAPSTGTVTLLVLLSPFADFVPSLAPAAGGLSRTSYTQAQNLATDNRPTVNVAAGLNLAGVRGWRVRAQAPTGETITSGTLNLHLYDPDTGLWGQSMVQFGDLSEAAGLRTWQSLDQVCTVPYGYAYVELANGVASGAGAFTINFQGWG